METTILMFSQNSTYPQHSNTRNSWPHISWDKESARDWGLEKGLKYELTHFLILFQSLAPIAILAEQRFHFHKHARRKEWGHENEERNERLECFLPFSWSLN
jgi:hypothetical protein